MSFIESPRFPDTLAIWAIGGAMFQSTRVRTFGAYEYANADWDQDLARFEIADAYRAADWQSASNNQADLRNFFMVCKAAGGARFRFKNFLDYKDEAGGILGTTGLAIAATVAYQMYKSYAMSPASYVKIVQKPVASTIKVYDNAVLQTTPADYTLNSATGVVTFASQPTIGHTLTWTGEFDLPVKFDDDVMMMGMDPSGALVHWQSLRLIQTREIT